MKKTILIAIMIIILSIICLLVYGVLSGAIDISRIAYISKVALDDVSVRFYYDERYTENNEHYIDIKIEDEEVLKIIKENLQSKVFKRTDHIWIVDPDIYNVSLSKNFLLKFDPMSNGRVDIEYKNRRVNGKIDKKAVDKIIEIANNAFVKDTTRSIKTETLELYTHDEMVTNMKKITDTEEINQFLSLIESAKLEQIGEVCFGSEFIKERMNLPKTYYEISINDYATLYADKDFQKVYLEKIAFLQNYNQNKNSRYLLKVSNIDKISKLFEEYYYDEDTPIIECGFENDTITITNPYNELSNTQATLSISAEETILSNEGINLILKLDGSSSFSRVRDNDFIIYKEDNGNWEELEAYVEPDKNTINKSSSKIIEKINWTQKYGVLEPGIYKLERTVNISDVETSYYVIFEIK